jgi:large subunit ribosomal protein L22
MKEARANIKFLRYSPKKMKILARVYKNKPVHYTLMQLESSSGKGYQLLKEAIKSAAANAVNNFRVDYNTLYIKDILSNEGPRLKRINIRAQGRADRMHRPMMHIAVTVVGEELAEDIRLRKKTDQAAVASSAEVKERLEPETKDSNVTVKASEESMQEEALEAEKTATKKGEPKDGKKGEKVSSKNKPAPSSSKPTNKEEKPEEKKGTKKGSKEDKK